MARSKKVVDVVENIFDTEEVVTKDSVSATEEIVVEEPKATKTKVYKVIETICGPKVLEVEV